MKESCILTNGGNLLRFHPKLLKYYFQRPNGEFLREVSNSEGEFIRSCGLHCEIEFINDHPKDFPIWEHFYTTCRLRDYSNFKAETSWNGGTYAHYGYEDWFVARVGDKTVFRYIIRHSTSSEFGYDELKGQFSQDLGRLYITNVSKPFYYETQCQYWDQESQSVIYNDSIILEEISTEAPFKYLWHIGIETIPSKWENEEQESQVRELSFSEKKEIVRFLKYECGIDLREGYRKSSRRPRYVKAGRR